MHQITLPRCKFAASILKVSVWEFQSTISNFTRSNERCTSEIRLINSGRLTAFSINLLRIYSVTFTWNLVWVEATDWGHRRYLFRDINFVNYLGSKFRKYLLT